MHERADASLPRGRLPIAAAAFALLFAACDDDGFRPVPEGLPDVSAVMVVDTAGPITRSLVIELERAAAVEVFYQPVDGGRTFRMRADSAAESHGVLLPRLVADTTYAYAVRSMDGAEVADSIARGTFTTGPLPANLASLDIDVEGDASFELLMLGQGQGAAAGSFSGQLGVEPDGRVVWYFPSPGFPLAAQPIPDSHDLTFIDGGYGAILRVTPAGEVVASLPYDGGAFGTIHHDVAAIDSVHVLYIERETQAVAGEDVTGEAVWSWNTRTGAVTKLWSAFDHLDWETERTARSQPTNWLHANSISIGPRNNVVLSLNRLDQVISIAPDFQSLEWRIGGPGATHPLAPEDRFLGQHSAFEVTPGRLALFDNLSLGEANARAIEIAIEEDTAYVVWSYEPDPAISADLRSGIYRLESGNRLVSFSTIPLVIDEVDETGQRVWRMVGNNLSPAFRAVPWPSIAGEVRVDAMP